jgi:hypothetical protein
MPTQNPPNQTPAAQEPLRRDQDPSRKSQGPNNPLPGEPGGPTTSGHAEPSAPPDDKDRAKDDRSKR